MGSRKLELGTSQPARRVSYPGWNTLAPITKISRLDGSTTASPTKKRCARQGAKFLSSLAFPLRCRRGRRLSSVYVRTASMCSLRWCLNKKKSAARPRSQVLAKSCLCPTTQARATSRRAFVAMSARYTSHSQSALQKITFFRPETCSGSPI